MSFESPAQVNVASWFVDRLADQVPDRFAIYGEPAPLRYGELRALVNRAGRALQALGCTRGDRVLIALPDSAEFIAAFFGAAKIGAIAVPVNPLAAAADYAHFLADSGARVIVIHADVLDRASAALGERAIDALVVGADATGPRLWNWDACVQTQSALLDPCATAGCDPALILYTSGSTGRQKAVVHAHANMLAASRNMAHGVLEMRQDDRTLSVSKLFFAFGLGNGMYFPLSVGAGTILNPAKPTLHATIALIARHRPTLLFAVPTFLSMLFKEIEQGTPVDLSSVRAIVSAGEPAPMSLWSRVKSHCGLDLCEGLGSTEMLQTFLSNGPRGARAGTLGREVPNYDIELRGEDDRPVADGQLGALWVRGGSAFASYWNNAELTNRTKVDGWVATGDRLSRDADGFYHFAGREGDMLKVSGLWVSPRDVESAVREHPGVDSAVVLVRQRSEDLKHLVAYVVFKPGAAPPAHELRGFLARRLPAHSLPGAIVVLPEMPLTGTGKVDRQALPSSTGDAETPGSTHTAAHAHRGTPTENELAAIWRAVLEVPDVHLSDNFMDLGGDSIAGMQCLARVRQQWDVDLPLDVLFSDDATVSAVAQLIDTRGARSRRRRRRAARLGPTSLTEGATHE